MPNGRVLYGLWICLALSYLCARIHGVTEERRRSLRDTAKEMFFHAYNAYMDNAYPADELMPLSCKGRVRGVEPSRGDIDDALGKYSLTLIDSLDTLAVMGELKEFAAAIKRVAQDVTVSNDVVVSVFETNIRVLGGLLSAHVLASLFRSMGNIYLSSYNDEMLTLAEDIAKRLLPAFNTATGLPYPRVNLKYGVNRTRPDGSLQSDTCTACAGSNLMEFAALSRLTGNPVYEQTARKAMNAIWQNRNKVSNLVGNVINVDSGRWVRQDAGVGAGIDSYYEYCLKSYVLLGDVTYWDRFQKHYDGIMRYVRHGAALVDVYLGNPQQRAKNFMDALLAFWPGLQVLKGDLEPAVSTHHMLFHVMKQHKFIPEAFTVDFRVHWAQHPLRPEFIESTYFLYQATQDPHYRRVGEEIIHSLQKYARVPCGFAAVQDVRTFTHEDRLDSFVLAETFKYLYLLFTEDEELSFDIDSFIFTTEAHLLPLSLSRFNATSLISDDETVMAATNNGDVGDCGSNRAADGSCHQHDKGISDRFCDNLASSFGGTAQVADNVRDKLSRSLKMQRVVRSQCHSKQSQQEVRVLKPGETDLSNSNHIKILADMGIVVNAMELGQIQLAHDPVKAISRRHAEEGLLFMQKMVQRVKMQEKGGEQKPVLVEVVSPVHIQTHFIAGPALFGPSLQGDKPLSIIAGVKAAEPAEACSGLQNGEALQGYIALIRRGGCMFAEKVMNVQSVGARAAVIVDNQEAALGQLPFAMSSDTADRVKIPSAFLLRPDGELLWSYMMDNEDIQLRLSGDTAEARGPEDNVSMGHADDGQCESGHFECLSAQQKERHYQASDGG